MIPDDHESVAVEHRRTALAKLVAHRLVAEILLPHELAVHVVRVKAARLERCNDMLAVGHRRGRGPGAVVLMRGFVRRLFARRVLPPDAAVTPGERHGDVPMSSAPLDGAPRRMRLRPAGPGAARGP